MSKNVLVFGARGFLGEHVVAQLCLAGHRVFAVVRPGAVAAFPSSNVHVLQGDCCDVGFVQAALDGMDAVIFSAGRTWQPGLEIEQYRRQNVAITQAFFDALGKRPETRVVFTSSLSTVAGSQAPRVYREDSGREGISEAWLSPYDRAKIDCERIALQSAAQGNNVVILNPGLLLGPGATATSNVAAPFCLLWFLQGQFAAKFYVNGGVTLSDVRDVAAAHVTALDHGTAGDRYILGGHNLNRRTFYERVVPLAGRRLPKELPAGALFALTSAADGLAKLTHGVLSSPVHRSFARTQPLYYFGDSQKAIAQLAYAPRPLEQTIVDMIQYYQSRDLLPASFTFPAELTAESAPRYVLLKQLVKCSGYKRSLEKRLPELYQACQANHQLRNALTQLLSLSRFNARRGRFVWNRGDAKAELQTLQKFLEYVRFASNDFLRQVL